MTETPRAIKPEDATVVELIAFVSMTHTYPGFGPKALVTTLAEFYNPAVGYAEVSQALLCEQLNVTRQTISTLTKQVEETGLWRIVRSGYGGLTRYYLSDEERGRFLLFLHCLKAGVPFSEKPIVKIAPNDNKKRTDVGKTKVGTPGFKLTHEEMFLLRKAAKHRLAQDQLPVAERDVYIPSEDEDPFTAW